MHKYNPWPLKTRSAKKSIGKHKRDFVFCLCLLNKGMYASARKGLPHENKAHYNMHLHSNLKKV